jgi:hypothetical protein
MEKALIIGWSIFWSTCFYIFVNSPAVPNVGIPLFHMWNYLYLGGNYNTPPLIGILIWFIGCSMIMTVALLINKNKRLK